LIAPVTFPALLQRAGGMDDCAREPARMSWGPLAPGRPRSIQQLRFCERVSMFEKLLGKKGITALIMAALTFLMLDARAFAAAVSISTPSNGATVSGMVTVTLSLGSSTSWAN